VAPPDTDRPMHVKLTDERRERVADAIQRFFAAELDQELSDFQVERLIDFLAKQLGAPIYNQAIQDARVFFQSKLDDLDGEFYEPEEPL
jgi:uncharacterized protein (DUF2164 family)